MDDSGPYWSKVKVSGLRWPSEDDEISPFCSSTLHGATVKRVGSVYEA